MLYKVEQLLKKTVVPLLTLFRMYIPSFLVSICDNRIWKKSSSERKVGLSPSNLITAGHATEAVVESSFHTVLTLKA